MFGVADVIIGVLVGVKQRLAAWLEAKPNLGGIQAR
jgi:hypothetical protein